MCILTYIPLKNGFLFTSNRDEQLQRATQDPKFYIRKEQRLLYPKDAKKGGTWFAVHPKKRSAVSLLNAKDEEGSVNPSSSQSRGKMPLKLLIEGNEFRKFLTSKLAPFCMISISNPSIPVKLTSYRWDRKNLEILSLDPSKPYLWCSTSLYNDEEYNKTALHFQKKNKKFKGCSICSCFSQSPCSAFKQ